MQELLARKMNSVQHVQIQSLFHSLGKGMNPYCFSDGFLAGLYSLGELSIQNQL